MSFEVPGATALDDAPCRYGESKLLVRGPRRNLDQPYISFLGSSNTYGKFVEQPFAAMTEDALGKTCVNLGCVNAGVDTFLNDPDIVEISRAASIKVVQVMGVQNLSNRYYRVHPRRNDRFLEPTALLTALYREVDFTEFHFNKHLLHMLAAVSPDRFETIRNDLRTDWIGRMRLLLKAIGPKTLLVWLRHTNECTDRAAGADPLLVNQDVLGRLAADTLGLVEIEVQPAGRTGDLGDMHFGALQAPVAEQSIGPMTHAMISEKLAAALRPHL